MVKRSKMKYSIPLTTNYGGSHQGTSRAANGRPETVPSAVTILVADMSDVVRNWLCELLRVRPDWTVVTSSVNAFSMAMRLPPTGKQIAIIGSPDAGLVINIAEKLRSLRPFTEVILFADFESSAGKEEAKKHAQAVVPRTTDLAGGMLATVETLLQEQACE